MEALGHLPATCPGGFLLTRGLVLPCRSAFDSTRDATVWAKAADSVLAEPEPEGRP